MNERRPGIQSALGTVSHASNVGQRKVLTVSDPTEEEGTEVVHRSFSSGNFNEPDEIPENIISKEELEQLALNREKLQSSRKITQQQKHRIPEGLKQRLEILTGIGRLTEDVEVDNVTFSLRSLKPTEHEDVIKSLIGIEYQALQAYEHRAQVLARSLFKIDGQNVDLVIGTNSVEERVEFIKNVLEESLVAFLYTKYNDIINNTKSKFSELGKTEAEVVENVKKS